MNRLLTSALGVAIFAMSHSAAHAVPLLGSFSFSGETYNIISYDDGVTYTHSNSGDYLGTVVNVGSGGANDSIEMVEAALTALGMGSVEITSSSKVEGTVKEGDFPLVLTYDPDNKSGTWETTDDPATLINIYVVKGSSQFALYLEDPAMDNGSWDVGNLQTNSGGTPSISHFSGYTTPPAVPEPGTLLLLGTGLLGLGLMRRRKTNS